MGNKIADEDYVLNKWKHEFSNLFNLPSDVNSKFDGRFYDTILNSLSEVKRHELDNTDANNFSYNSPFTLDELDKTCRHIKQGKAVGPGMIPNEVLNYTSVCH